MASNANIGLGVASPASKLDVAGDINLTNNLKWQDATVLQYLARQNEDLRQRLAKVEAALTRRR